MNLVRGVLLFYLLLLSAWFTYFLIKLGWELQEWWKRRTLLKLKERR